MSAYAIRYRRNGAGPAAFLVECDGRLHIYSHGVLGAAMPDGYCNAIRAGRVGDWVPAAGDLLLHDEPRKEASYAADIVLTDARRPPRADDARPKPPLSLRDAFDAVHPGV